MSPSPEDSTHTLSRTTQPPNSSSSSSQTPYSPQRHQHQHQHTSVNDSSNSSRDGSTTFPVPPVPLTTPTPAPAPAPPPTITISTATSTSASTTSTNTTGSQTSPSHYYAHVPLQSSSSTPSSTSTSSSASSFAAPAVAPAAAAANPQQQQQQQQQGYQYYPPSYRAYYYSESGDHHSLQQRQIGLKEVVRMACRFCEAVAQLLADQTIGLFSTDDAPVTVELIGDAYQPTNCSCEISDTACLVCGNAIGYHIMQPCKQCLSAENNGHLWLFHPEYVFSSPRYDPALARPLRWQDLPRPEQDDATKSLGRPIQRIDLRGRLVMGGMVRRDYESICR
ncbi:Protein fam72a [Actinomortierella ambigua]|nr:Protein fam72a [Actinomortierella ambigua]